MSWTWNVRSNDGAMNGLEFARCTTAGGFGRVLVHAAPGRAEIEIIDGDDQVVARAGCLASTGRSAVRADHDDCKPVFRLLPALLPWL
jgi:hypothetical protein